MVEVPRGQVGVPVALDAPGGRRQEAADGPVRGVGRGRVDDVRRPALLVHRAASVCSIRTTPPMILSMLSNRRSTLVRAVLVGVALVVWLGIGSVGGMAQGKLSQVQTNDASAFLPSSAESTRAAEESKGFVDTRDTTCAGRAPTGGRERGHPRPARRRAGVGAGDPRPAAARGQRRHLVGVPGGRAGGRARRGRRGAAGRDLAGRREGASSCWPTRSGSPARSSWRCASRSTRSSPRPPPPRASPASRPGSPVRPGSSPTSSPRSAASTASCCSSPSVRCC